MKNFNLFEKLWEHSRTLRRVGLVLALCLITITQMWAAETYVDVYLYTGQFTNWENDGATFKVGTGDDATGTTMTSLGNHWYKCNVATGSKYIKRCSSDGNTKWNKFGTISISTTNYVVKATGWDAGSLFTMGIAGNGWNSIGSWSNNNSNGKMTPSGSTFSKSFTNVAASAHLFKIVEQGTWDRARNWNSGTVTGVNCAVQDDGSNDHNIQFTPYIATGTTTITYDVSTGEITVTCPKIPITLDKNGGTSAGSATVDVGASSLSTISHASRTNWNLTGYWTASSGGYKVINADGTFVDYNSNVSTYLNNATPSTWKKTSATTLYAQWTQDPTISLSLSSSTAVRGDAITLTAATTNASTPTIVYEYSTSSTFASAVTSIASTTSTSQSWTVPAGTSGTTYYLRAKMTISSTTYYSDILSLTAYGKKTIKVKDTNNWGANFKIHRWGGSADATEWPGETTNITSAGGQWKQVVLLSSSTNFLFCNGETTSTADANKTANQTYDGMSDDGCYEIATGPGGSLALTSTANCPAKPTVTASAATSKTNTTATMNGNISSNGNDNITDYGFYWSTTYTTAAALQSSGTKVQKGTSNYTGSLTHGLTGLTAATTVYYIAFATNGQGTTLSSVQNFVVPYSVTITKPTGCSSITPAAGTYYYATGFEVTTVAATGYTFDSWSTSNGATSSASSPSTGTNKVTFTPSANSATIQPVYEEDMHDVTLNSSVSGGHVEISSETVTSTSAGIATASPTITAVADSGYYFTGWTGDIGSGVTLASGTTSSAAITIRATADSKSITANFARRWVLTGEWLKDGNNWDITTNVMSVIKLSKVTFVYNYIDGLAANTEYKFKLYDNTSGDHWVGFATSGEVYDYTDAHDSIVVNTYGGSGHDITLKTAAQGRYYFYYNLKNHKLNISFPASRQVTMGTRTETDGITSAYTGGTISAVDNSSNVITNGLYVASDASITFTATPKSGYIWRGWYNSSGCTGEPVSMDRVHTDYSVTVGFQRYALFEEALYTVKVHRSELSEITAKVGIDTHPTITAGVAPTGMIFDRWVTTGSATVADPYSSSTTITSATDDVSTVTATFKDLPKIYIDMTSATDWNPSNMYVVFYKDGGYFDGSNGTGLSSTYVITPTPLEMTKMDGKKIWYYSYDPTSGVFENQTITCVAFVDHTFAANTGNFSSATVTYRTDFSSCMNMFVVTDNSGTNKNSTCYYRNTNAIDGTKGYWRKYEENNSGFYLNNLPGGSIEFTNEDGGNTYTTRVNLDANTTYYFYLGCCNGWNWSNDKSTKAFNSDNRTRMVVPYDNVGSNDYRCQLTTTAAGYYTFSITPQNTREVQLSIDFPVAANDYRAVYNNAASSPTVSRPSNIIKNDQNSGTISLWLNKGTNYISFQKATLGVGGAVSWTSCGSQQTVTGVPEAGIYTMTLTRDNTTYTVSTPVAYTGDLYIRTDCAPGQWADYTENKMDVNTFNFSATDPNTFDYYYCKWINDAGTNVRCVIANEINVALSDTLKGEDILESEDYPDDETLPEGANVRFSYNSLTNTLKRSYLTGASTDVFLNIMPDAASKVYKTDGTTDMRNSGVVGATNKFSDLGNWVYELDAKVKPGATAAVKANYNSTSQALIAAGTTLLGGTEDVLYQIRLIYDFRTNYLMSAWMPDGNVDEAISLNSDIMIVRRGQEDANQLSFSGDGELTDVKRAYGVFEFNKDEMATYMNSWDTYTYEHCMYYFSLPFDVNVRDIFGVGTMGDDWRIQFYNGKKRAEKGWFAGDGTTTFWEDVPADTVLHAYEGYLLMLNRTHFNNRYHAVWNNVTSNAYLYFPSVAPVAALAENEVSITVPSYECTIDRFFTQDSLEYYNKDTKTWSVGARNHKYVDSHWNMMGTPLFQDATADKLTACKVTINDVDSTLNYVYEWVPSTNSLSARRVLNTDFEFRPMYAYMVQYAGTVTFTGASITLASIAARRISEHKQYTIELELTKENKFADRTYIELRENAVDTFLLNEDLYMMKGSKVGNIYTHADGYELAANVLSVNSHIVPVSVETKSAGTYTISMPSNFSGTVTLIDKFANTRTNLAIEDYEIYLEKGTISGRFELEININNTPTAIDGVGDGNLKDGKAHKFIMNDQMYILQNGVIYDARGARVK